MSETGAKVGGRKAKVTGPPIGAAPAHPHILAPRTVTLKKLRVLLEEDMGLSKDDLKPHKDVISDFVDAVGFSSLSARCLSRRRSRSPPCR